MPLCLPLVATILAVPAIPASAQLPPPHASYRTFDTEHFRVTYSEGLQGPAAEAARFAEQAHAVFREGFFPAPPGRIELLLVDHTDFSNGSARVAPYNRVTIWVHPPLDGHSLSDFDDWLDLVVTHEVAHVFHLDHTGTPGRFLRSVFGRPPFRWPYFPGYTLPPLAIEGIAVELESRHTGGGRVDGSGFPAILRSRALSQGGEPLARSLAPVAHWPGGQRPYAYGGLFFAHLTELYGSAAVADFFRGAAEQWVPYRLDSASRRAFGRSFGELWDTWMDGVVVEGKEALRAVRSAPEWARSPQILTPGSRSALSAAPSPDAEGVAYLRSDGRSDTRVVLWTPEGERTIARWNAGEVPLRWTPDGVLLAPDVRYLDRYRVQRDLWRLTPAGEVERLTTGLRVIHADPHPRGEGIAAVLGGGGTTRLVVLSPDGTVQRTLASAEPGVLWMHPSWSPDGERLAVVRRREGGGNAVLVLAPDGRVLNEIEEERARPRAPAWGPGGESLVWATDRGGTPNLHGVRMGSSGGPVGPVLQITALPTAGSFPAVDEQGRWIYLSILGADGWELGRIPYRPEEWFEPLSPLGEYGGAAHSPPESSRALDVVVPDVPDSRRYRALPSLVPRYWLPVRTAGERVLGRTVLPVAWGAQSSGADLLERHRWSLRVAAPVRDPGRRVEWGGAYVWAGLGNPVLTVEAGQGWEARPAVLGGGADGAPADTLFPIRRERFAGGAVEFRRPRFRSVAALSLGGRILSIERILLDEGGTESESYGFVRPSGELAEARATATVSSVRGHAWSISTESGVAAALSVRQRWELALPDTLRGVGGADGGFREGVLTVRAFGNLEGPGFARHVVALRATGGIARGPGAGADHFEVGGDLRQFPVRGHPADALRGERAWSVSAEWRFPLGVLDAGPGAWPIYLDRLAGGVFFDTGGAGASGPSHGRAGATTIASAGVELALTHTLFWEELRRVALGVAFPVVSDRTPSVHARFGWSF